MLRYNYQPYCGGSIIGISHVLTAAHCLYDHSGKALKTDYIDVVVGQLKISDTRIVKKVNKTYAHENYKPGEVYYDIALIKVIKPFFLLLKIYNITYY